MAPVAYFGAPMGGGWCDDGHAFEAARRRGSLRRWPILGCLWEGVCSMPAALLERPGGGVGCAGGLFWGEYGSVSYTHRTLTTSDLVYVSVIAVTLKTQKLSSDLDAVLVRQDVHTGQTVEVSKAC